MLRIRKEQMEVFQQQAEINFVRYLVQLLHTNYNEAVADIPEDTLYKRVEYGIQRAREYGFTWKNNLSTFVTLMFVIAPEFDSSPVFRSYLTSEDVRPNERMDLLLTKTTEADWHNARQDPALTKWPGEP